MRSMSINIDKGAKSLINTLESAGFCAYITGKAIRDYLMDKPISYVKIATSASPSQITEIFSNHLNINHTTKTVTVSENNNCYEISTFNSPVVLSDRQPDLYDDLSATSFTIDAIAHSDKEGILDFFGGISDLKKQIIRTTSAPDDVFSKNPSAMLYAVELCTTLGFALEENTEKSIRKHSALAKNISRSYQLEAFNKILMSKEPEKGFLLMHDLGLLKPLIPKLDYCFYVPQRNKYHIYNVGEHIMHALASTPSDIVLRWAALLHDIGKPACKSIDNNGIIHFYGHHRESMAIADEILNKLRLDRELIRNIVLLIEYHDVRIDQTLPSIKRLMSKIGPSLFEKLIILQEADCRAKNPAYLPEKLEKTKKLNALLATVIEENQPYKISDLAINSRDLVKLKYKAGREISDALKVMLEEVIQNTTLNNREYLLNRAKNLRK